MKMCDCSASYANTGLPDCKTLMAVAKRMILVPTYDSTGVRNKIAAGDVLNAAYFTALINQADKTKRWYPLPEIVNVEDSRSEPVMETLADGKKIFVNDGPRAFKALMIKQPAQFKAKLDQWRCLGVSAFFVDKEGNLIGSTDGTDFYPIIIDNDTLFANLIKTTDTTTQKIELSFEFGSTEDDGDLRIITETEAGTNLLLLEGLLDVNMSAAASISTTTFKTTLTFDYGTFKTPDKLTGMVAADFALYNVTDSASVSISTCVESPDGTYTFTYSAQTSGDVLRLTPSVNGFEFTPLLITIP
jgi:hypothetical protein